MSDNIVKQWRGDRSQPDVAAELNAALNRNYEKATISRWENGNKVPRDVVEFITGKMAPPPPAMIIVVAVEKGGVGKTTTVVNVAALLAAAGHRVLAVDLDYHGGLTIHVGAADQARPRALTAHGLLTGADPQAIPIRPGYVDFDVIPAHVDLSALDMKIGSAILEAAGEGGDTVTPRRRLAEALAPLLPRYDVVLLDTPPGYGGMTMMALAAADEVLIPTEADHMSIEGVEKIVEAVQEVAVSVNPRIQYLGILPSKISVRESHQIHNMGTIATRYAGTVGLLGQIPRSAAFGRSVLAAGSAVGQKREVAQAYASVIRRIEMSLKMRTAA